MSLRIGSGKKEKEEFLIKEIKAVIEEIQEHNASSAAHSLIIPTKTSQLTNDSCFVSDSDYVHTDNNLTDELKTNLTFHLTDTSNPHSVTATQIGAPTITSGSNAPSSTPVKIGDIYIDTTNYKTYISKGTSSSSDWIKQNGCYTIKLMPLQGAAPIDSTTYYFGDVSAALTTGSSGTRRTYIPRNGVITSANFYAYLISGSNELSSFYVRVNSTTDYLVSNNVSFGNSSVVFNNTALNIPVSAGDYIEIKWVTPNWATNPTGIYLTGILGIDL